MFGKIKKALTGKPKRKAPGKKSAVKKSPAKSRAKKEKQIGKVTHYFGKIKVAVVKFGVNVRVGKKVRYAGATTGFDDVLASIQKDHVPAKTAKKGSSVGVKVKKKVRVGDCVFERK